MSKKFHLLFAIMMASTLLVSCNKIFLGKGTCKIGSVEKEFTKANSFNKGVLALSNGDDEFVSFFFPIPTTFPTTYDMNTRKIITVDCSVNGKQYSATNGALGFGRQGSFTIKITKYSNSRISGTFQFTAINDDHEQIVIKDGIFNEIPDLEFFNKKLGLMEDKPSHTQDPQDPKIEHQSNESKSFHITEIQDQEKSKTEEELISDIREKFGAINYNINSYTKVKKDVMEESTEGGELEGYFKNTELRKMITTYYGEMGKLIEEYYLWDDQLFFVFTHEHYYDKPMHMEGSKVSKINENRYYFYKDKLVRWLDPQKKKVAKSKFTEKGTEILQKSKKLKEKVK